MNESRPQRWPYILLGGVGGAMGVVFLCTLCFFGGVALLSLLVPDIEPAEDTLAFSSLGTGPAVGVVRVQGVILSGEPPVSPFATGGTAYSKQIIEQLRQAQKDFDVKAILLRVNSPGGSVVGSDEVYQVLRDEIDKPVVVSMGELAASGGYYIAAGADRIMANPATFTGSIGVILTVTNVQDLLSKVGVDVTIIKRGELKDELSPFRDMTTEEQALWQEIIDEAYEQFVGVVAEGRAMSVEEVRELADGRVYTGRQALELGLIDELGNMPDAIELAADLGGIKSKPRIIEHRRRPSFWDVFMFQLTRPVQPFTLNDFLGVDRRFVVQYLYVEP
ncbi:MAG: signal peptide peptidase SppA [Anaerolineae bacterium]